MSHLADVYAAHKGEDIAVFFFQLAYIHSRLDFKGLEAIEAGFDEGGDVRFDVAAAVQDDGASALVKKAADAFVKGLQELAVNVCGKEGAVFVSEVIKDERAVKIISHAEHLLSAFEDKVCVAFPYFNDPIRFREEGWKERHRTYDCGEAVVSYAGSKEDKFPLFFCFFKIGFIRSPFDAVFLKDKAVFEFFPSFARG